MARGSALEVQTQLELALRLNFGIAAEVETAQARAIEVGIILNSALTTMRTRVALRNKSKT